jgi:hypothetical protein
MSSKTTKGTKSSALLYSIVEKSKSNGLAVEKYLVYLFDILANVEFKECDILEKSMLFDKTFQMNCTLKLSNNHFYIKLYPTENIFSIGYNFIT